MNTSLESTKKILLAAFVGAAVTYGALTITSDDAIRDQQIVLLESRVQGLETLLTQREEELKNAQAFGLGHFEQGNALTVNKNVKKTSSLIHNQNADTPEAPAEEMTAAAPHADQVIKDLMTLFVGDPRSFTDKVNEFIASNPSKENIAIASAGVFNLANNRDILPDDSLQSLYLEQADQDLKRVVAQVASMRGDNTLIDMQIAETQTRLKSTNAEERQKALIELGKTRYAGAANAIAPLLQDNDIGVKLDALLALRATGNQSHIRLVEELVNHPNDSVSWLANDVINNLQNLSEKARTKLASADIDAELPPLATQ